MKGGVMKQVRGWIGGLVGLTLLIALVLALNFVFQAQVTQTGAAPPPTSAMADMWKNATLDTIQFGEPRAVFTYTAGIKIYDWLPDNRRLLVELEDPITQNPNARYRVVTLDVETGQLVEYGRRMDWSERTPVWLEKVPGVAFVTWNTWTGESPKVLLGMAGGHMRILDEHANATLAVDPRTGYLLYLKPETPQQPLWAVDVVSGRMVESPLMQANFPDGQLRIDPTGQWLVSMGDYFNRAPLYLANRNKGQINKIEFKSWRALDAIWSPHGNNLALILGTGDGLLTQSQIALLNPENLEWHFINLPTQFVIEVDWGPSERYFLVRGVPLEHEISTPHKLWLVDTTSGGWKETSNFPPIIHPESIFMAWSKTGQVAFLRGHQIMVTQALLGRTIR